MKKFSFHKGAVSLLLLTSLTSTHSQAQNVAASPQNIIRPFGGNTVTVALDRLAGGWGGSGTYVWSVSPSNGVTLGSYSQTNPNAGDVTATFNSGASGAYTFTLTRGSNSASVTVQVGNIAASSSSGSLVSAFSVLNGASSFGPGRIFNTTVSTSALGISSSGHFYYLPNTFTGNDGRVTVYAANPNGTGNTAIASIDLNGASNSDLGFVRLAIDPTGTGWILAGDNSQLYLGRFAANGLNATAIVPVDPSVTVINGTVSSFFNGDICFSGNGTMYALANSGNGGVTQIFTGTPNGSNTTLTKKWDLVGPGGNAFTGSVNGVAFDALGSLYISTSTGLYFINQQTVNTATGTVQCALVTAVTGLTDLASNYYPQQSTLPLTLLSFAAVYRSPSTSLSWETEAELNVEGFVVERSADGRSFEAIGNKPATGNGSSRQQYQFSDDLSSTGGTVFTYRLKMVDIDGQFKYSNTVLVRKETKQLNGIILNPSPVSTGPATIRFTATRAGHADFKVIDLSGKIILQQQARVLDGTNSITLNNTERLQAGTYILQMVNDGEPVSLKFTVVK